MDFLVVGAVVIAGWLILSVLSSERMTRSQQIAIALATAAAEAAKAAAEVPVAVANDDALAGSPAAFNRKR